LAAVAGLHFGGGDSLGFVQNFLRNFEKGVFFFWHIGCTPGRQPELVVLGYVRFANELVLADFALEGFPKFARDNVSRPHYGPKKNHQFAHLRLADVADVFKHNLLSQGGHIN
jgi:hypothetical protein